MLELHYGPSLPAGERSLCLTYDTKNALGKCHTYLGTLVTPQQHCRHLVCSADMGTPRFEQSTRGRAGLQVPTNPRLLVQPISVFLRYKQAKGATLRPAQPAATSHFAAIAMATCVYTPWQRIAYICQGRARGKQCRPSNGRMSP